MTGNRCSACTAHHVERYTRGGAGESVFLVLRGGQKIQLAGFSAGAPVVAATLRSWWERARGEM